MSFLFLLISIAATLLFIHLNKDLELATTPLTKILGALAAFVFNWISLVVLAVIYVIINSGNSTPSNINEGSK